MFRLTANDHSFPRPELALRDPNGLLAIGGDLHPDRLINAYRNGIFPWFSDDTPPLWWSPDPRAVFTPESMHESRSMKRFRQRTELQVTLNSDFSQVIAACADIHEQGAEGTWITPELEAAFNRLHQLGHAHSVEVWQDKTLVGGMYGVAIGTVFCGESMFHRQTNASKLALFVFAQHFFGAGGEMLDAQVANPHLSRLGMHEIPRQQFLHLLRTTQQDKAVLPGNFWQSRQLSHKSSGNCR
ncbi:Leucyl/phenylalanyl-tRNA--protein transferase [Pseudidiomarina piscicola]|uniref:Leucyl/phenylalanyl-tRNA--protein transferase n=1 Tax=Pseudidiomarina piscicola TaxID=2614830 RepID=A0A6S6WM59_9GAMM|nr:leucyl/phenylalanyl-tRNA--protein transferase [Pseudidiomarina piscicola]CAB0150018.1 Leucyl/phenylalanyl-tRNA--protein transferase [Pseudidiomarina piscicola]VZT39463.1 Leucyl/phenylalanyl-tRNA--protein transferase [Pseudomonas aeruginosa]